MSTFAISCDPTEDLNKFAKTWRPRSFLRLRLPVLVEQHWANTMLALSFKAATVVSNNTVVFEAQRLCQQLEWISLVVVTDGAWCVRKGCRPNKAVSKLYKQSLCSEESTHQGNVRRSVSVALSLRLGWWLLRKNVIGFVSDWFLGSLRCVCLCLVPVQLAAARKIEE